MSTAEERMSPEEQAKARLLVDAGVYDLKHLALITGVPHVTIWRYWTHAPDRMSFVVLKRMADALLVSVDDLHERLRRADNRYCGLTPSDLYEELLSITEPDRHHQFRALQSLAAS